MANLSGSTVGKYRVIEQIGQGGMASVYKTYQPGMDRLVALKVMPAHFASYPQFVQRFEREAQLIARLEHPHIVPIHDYGEDDGITYIVMRYIRSGTLKDVIARGRLSSGEVLALLGEVADALDYAHANGIVHRDVKPSNVLVDGRGHTYLTDFGIAKVLEGTQELTGSGVLGTPSYMAPEQTLGRNVGPAADQYALGVVAYEMLTGRQPYSADTPMAIALMHVHEPLPLPRSLNPALSERAEQVLLKALAKDPTDRYPTVRAFVDDLRSALPDEAGGDVALAAVAEELAAAAGSDRVTQDVRQRLRAQQMTDWRRRALGAVPLLLAAVVTAAAVVGILALVNPQRSDTAEAPAVAEVDNTATSSATPLLLSITNGPSATVDLGAAGTEIAGQTATQAVGLTATAGAIAEATANSYAATATVLARTPTETPVPSATPTITSTPPPPTLTPSPTTAILRSISVDGDAGDWGGIPATYVDAVGDSRLGAGMDLYSVQWVMDATNVYVVFTGAEPFSQSYMREAAMIFRSPSAPGCDIYLHQIAINLSGQVFSHNDPNPLTYSGAQTSWRGALEFSMPRSVLFADGCPASFEIVSAWINSPELGNWDVMDRVP